MNKREGRQDQIIRLKDDLRGRSLWRDTLVGVIAFVVILASWIFALWAFSQDARAAEPPQKSSQKVETPKEPNPAEVKENLLRKYIQIVAEQQEAIQKDFDFYWNKSMLGGHVESIQIGDVASFTAGFYYDNLRGVGLTCGRRPRMAQKQEFTAELWNASRSSMHGMHLFPPCEAGTKLEKRLPRIDTGWDFYMSDPKDERKMCKVQREIRCVLAKPRSHRGKKNE